MKSKARSTKYPKYEYTIIPAIRGIQHYLDKYAAEGWEPVTVLEKTSYPEVIFRREL